MMWCQRLAEQALRIPAARSLLAGYIGQLALVQMIPLAASAAIGTNGPEF